MAAKRPQQQSVTPGEAGMGMTTPPFTAHNDHSFTLQAVMELQKSVGEMNASIKDNTVAINSLKSKVDDLVGWKHKIIGGAVAIGSILTLLGFLIAKFSDHIKIV